MGIFDSLFGGAAGQLKRHGRRVADRDAQADDREASAHWLAENGSDEALRLLLGRFGLQLEHTLKDHKEKEKVLGLLVEHGARAAAVAREQARSTPAFQWPLKLVDRVEGAAAGTALLLDLLAIERVEEEFKVEKKRNLLLHLAERKDAAIVEAAARFLVDFDEGVRHGAVEALAAQDGGGARPHLLAALLSPTEESTRIRGRLAEIFAQRRWSTEDPQGWLAANVPNGFRLVDGRILASR